MPDRVTVGSVEIADVYDGVLEAHPTFLFSGIPPSMYEEALGAELVASGSLPIKRGGFLVRSSGKNVLVDTGVGLKNPRMQDSVLLQSLEKLGVRPNDVDVVINTHLHFDHVGWNCSERGGGYVPTFPNAEYWISRAEWDFWTDPLVLNEDGAHLKTDVLPLKDSPQLHLYEGEAAVTPELTLMPTPGHTPGHASVAVTSDGERAVILGDVAHHPLHLIRIWVCAIDESPRLSRRTKRKLAEMLVDQGALVAGGHFTPNSFGRLVMLEGRRAWAAL